MRKKSDDMPSTDSDETVSRSPEVSAGGGKPCLNVVEMFSSVYVKRCMSLLHA